MPTRPSSSITTITFGTSGYRGRWGRDYTEPVVRDIAQAICDYLLNEGLAGKTVVVGYDSREFADIAAGWCTDVARRNGFIVHLTERDTPTPALAFYAGEVLGDDAAGVINCTSSHNPINWHGIKFSLADGSISPPRTTNFIGARATEYRKGDRGRTTPSLSFGQLVMIDPRDAYCRWLLDSGTSDCRIPLDHARMRQYYGDKLVIIDEMHGTGREYLRTVFDAIGIPYRVIHAERDPRLGGLHAANPEEPHIRELKEAVAETGAVLGVGLDTDADRYGIVDRGGQYIEPNAILAMLTRYLGVDRKLKGCIATTFVTTHMLERIAAAIEGNDAFRPSPGALPTHRRDPGYQVVRGEATGMVTENVFTVLTGLKYVIQVPQMDGNYDLLDDPPVDWRCRLLIGGEQASGLTSKGHVPDKDGMWANLLVLDMAAYYGKPLREIWEETQSLFGPSNTAPINLTVPEEAKAPFIDSFLAAGKQGTFADLPVVFAGGISGKYAELMLRDVSGNEDNFVHIRPSGTEPLIRVYLEAATESVLAQLVDTINTMAAAL